MDAVTISAIVAALVAAILAYLVSGRVGPLAG